MNPKYESEILEFHKHFDRFRDKRIVLYGIGRYTATLLEGILDFHFVGLMDKDPANIGRELFGLPVLDKREAEEKADLVIINTAETYWKVIYSRIADIRIPVYYKNGILAQKEKTEKPDYPYDGLSIEALQEKAKSYRILSFDFFDTLFMRTILNPPDLFKLLGIDRDRSEALAKCGQEYTFEEIYAMMGKEHDPKEELALEKKLLKPREEILCFFKGQMEQGKEIYIISDMYLPRAFYTEVLGQYGIPFPEDNILVSCELKKSKKDGKLWAYYAGEIVKGRRALHLGDHEDADIREAGKYGIDTYLVPNPCAMLEHSSIRDLYPHANSVYASAVTGLLMAKLFAYPYRLSASQGQIYIQSEYDMGYLVFGPVILTFLLWIAKEAEKDDIRKLIFMSRDGYFLKEDYEYLATFCKGLPECDYIGISRQLAMYAAVSDEKELREYAEMPYSGTVGEQMEDRFGILPEKKASAIKEAKEIWKLVEIYRSEIGERQRKVRAEYKTYLGGHKLSEDCAVIDLGYYGNNQYYLNQLLGLKLPGYYSNANLSEKNPNTQRQRMKACFQTQEDVTGAESNILKKQIYLESFLTAPYGMVKEVLVDGTFVCAPPKENQRHFENKRRINEGVKGFLWDYMSLFGEFGLYPDTQYADIYYGCMTGDGVVLEDEIKQSFYNDNAMMNRMESSLYY